MLKPVTIMRTITKGSFSSTVAVTLLLGATLSTSLSAASLTIPLRSLAATKSGNDLLLSFPTASPPAVPTAWAAVTWDFAGNLISSTALSNAPAVNINFLTTDVYGDTIYNAGTKAYLAVPTPAAPNGGSAIQSGDQFQVSWTPNGVNPAAVTWSVLTATPVNSTNSILTTTVGGSATHGIISS